MGRRREMPESVVDAARALRETDPRLWTYARLAERFGVGHESLYYHLNPCLQRQQIARDVETKEASAGKRDAEHRADRVDQKVLAARLREIPADTRGLTERICGDPLPGRSAFDRQRRQT